MSEFKVELKSLNKRIEYRLDGWNDYGLNCTYNCFLIEGLTEKYIANVRVVIEDANELGILHYKKRYNSGVRHVQLNGGSILGVNVEEMGNFGLEYNWKSYTSDLNYYEVIFQNIRDPHGFLLNMGDLNVISDLDRLKDVVSYYENNLMRGYSSSQNDEKFLGELRSSMSNIRAHFGSDFKKDETYSAVIEDENGLNRFNLKHFGPFFPYRTHVITGKNGVGKTKYLYDLYRYQTRRGDFRVLYGNFSVFDDGENITTVDNLVLNSNNSDNFGEESFEKFKNSLIQLSKNSESNKLADLTYRLQNVFSENWQSKLALIKSVIESKPEVTYREFKQNWSTGEIVFLYFVTNLINLIGFSSLIILDEIDAYFHPNYIGALMQFIEEISNAYSSYAIMTTHSPILLQQLTSENVHVMKKRNDERFFEKPVIQTFGNDISTISDEIFEIKDIESGYRNIIRSMINIGRSKQEILSLLPSDLSISAKIYIDLMFTTGRIGGRD